MTERTSVALGSFDGLHRGHLAVLQSALSFADDGLLPFVLLFDRHPLSVLRGTAPPSLLEPAQRDRLLSDMGVQTKVIRFEDIRDMEPARFVRDVLCDAMHAGAVSCGYNYRFGKNSAGDAQMLRALCETYGIQVHICAPVCVGNEPVSSTRIREKLAEGDVDAAQVMLSRPFSFSGTVVHGNANGRLWGYPTANMAYPPSLAVPRYGVYASDAALGGKTYRAITNVGVRPTLQGTTLGTETHIPGMERDLYGETLTVSLRRFIRPEQKFDALEDVFRQVRQDIRTAYPNIQNGESV